MQAKVLVEEDKRDGEDQLAPEGPHRVEQDSFSSDLLMVQVHLLVELAVVAVYVA